MNPRRWWGWLLAVSLAVLCPVAVGGEASSASALRVAAVQLEVSERDVVSLDAFSAHMRALARLAVSGGADLLVFPEYTGALAGLIPYSWAVVCAGTAEQALRSVGARDPSIGSVRDVFLATSDFALRAMLEVFGGIAASHGIHVVAGTYLAREKGRIGQAALRNRALVFGPDGSLVYAQDKVYLTEFEELAGIEPGEVSAARTFAVAGHRVGLTICRDTFFGSWEPYLAGADLWIDIKGNGERFGPEVAERFARALPARLRSSGVRAGITVCLNGGLLDFVWEGPSSYVLRLADGSVDTAARARSVHAEEVLVVDVQTP